MADQVTLKDVAAHAGVSRSTASNVVMGTGRVSVETRRRVQASMEKLGYIYNQGAATLRRRTSSTVGVIVTHIDHPFFGELLVGLEATLTAAGFPALVLTTGDDPRRQLELVRVLREHQVAGLAIVPATGTGPELLESLRSWGAPHVLMTRYLRSDNAPYVGPDDRLGGRLAGAHLVGHGCSRFAFVGGPDNVVSRSDRFAGVQAALRTAGIDETSLASLTTPTTSAGGVEAGEQLLASAAPLPEGIVCHSDTVAMGLYRALHRAGRADETRVIGYDNIAAAALWEPTLTTVATGAGDLGTQAAELLLAAISSGEPAESRIVPPHLVVRESCGC
jgi:LacI family transcriptional regulator